MIMDKRTEFCAATALNTGGAGTYNIGNLIDTGASHDVGLSSDLSLVVQITTTATSGGSATLQIKLVSDATSTISTTTATVHATSATFAVADLAVGTSVFVIELPQEGVVYERYLAVQQVTGTAAFTAGAVDAFLTNDPVSWRAYADGNN